MTAMTRAEAAALVTAPGEPYELEIVDAGGGRQVRMFKGAPPSLRALYESTATPLPFLSYEDAAGREAYTFAEAWQQASRIAHVLVHECGVKHGDRVAVAMRNYPHWPLSFMAITSIGAVIVAVNAHWQAEEMAAALDDVGAVVLIADAERVERHLQKPAASVRHVLAVRTDRVPDGVRDLHALTAALGSADVAMPPAEIAPNDLATMLFTSGSSGRSKVVPSTHRNVLAALLSWEADQRMRDKVAGVEPLSSTGQPAEQAGTLLAVPLFHVTGLHSSFLMCFRGQRRMTTMYRWDAEVAASLIDRERLSSVGGPAAITGDLVRVAQSGKYDLSTLTAVGGGGAPRAPEQVMQIRKSFKQAMPNIGWGMTETNAIGAGNSGQEYLDRPTSSGRCSLVLDMKIVDEEGRTLAAGQRGELLIRGASVFAGYWNHPQANAESFVDGWFRTGDGAVIDADGYLYIVDRIKDLIIRGGENIGCGHVEAALLMHPDVHEASVYAVPDERLGEEVGATVYGSPSLDIDALREFLTQHLARFEIPRYIVRSPEPLRRTATGKIFKREIRAEAVATLTSKETT